MKKLQIALITLCFLMTSPVWSQSFYDIETINTIEIVFEESNWDNLLDNLEAAGNEERLLGTVTLNGQVFDSVGVRYKGNSSYNSSNAKNPFNIKLDYVIDQKYEDFGTIKLSNGYKDPSFVREVLGYEIARKYMPAPLSNYANVYVNGDYIGMYTSNQDVDKYFMRTHFVDDENARFKGEINEAKGMMGGVWQYLGDDSTDYAAKFVIESDTGWSELINFLYTLNYDNTEVYQELNIDRHLWFLAFSNLLVNLDGPINNPQNHYLFQDMSYRFNPIPWDLNECFGVFTMIQSERLGPPQPSNLAELDPFLNSDESDYPVVSKILSIDKYKKMYVAHMKTIIDENFSNGWYEDRAFELQDIIASDYQNDNNTFYTYSEMTNNVNNSIGNLGPPPNQMVTGITELMELRIDYLLAVSEFAAEAPEIATPNYSPTEPSIGEEISFTAEFSTADNAYFAYRYDDYSIFTKLEMFDDGAHNDGVSGDGVYGVIFTPESALINYYFYAENTDAAAFLPVRAEYEFFSLELAGDVVINEFMASNQETVNDQDGEDDDWIELYNNSDLDINLSGYYLSDKPNNTDKWQFPDTSISAGGYLIIWADEDTLQAGLHANFKLSAGGESVVLSTPDKSIINQCTYDAQETDISYGRYPNGTGEFCTMPPTFSAENMQSSAIQEINKALSAQVYPNPARNYIDLSFGETPKNPIEIRIFSIVGSLVYHSTVNDQLTRISLSELKSGMYVLYAKSGDLQFHTKFIKE
jgi:hypothetical protein